MARIEGRTMEIKNRLSLTWGILIKFGDFQEITICIKYTKTSAVFMTSHWRNSNYDRKFFQMKLPVAIMPEI